MQAAISRKHKMLTQILTGGHDRGEFALALPAGDLAYLLNSSQFALALQWATGTFPRGALRGWLDKNLAIYLRTDQP